MMGRIDNQMQLLILDLDSIIPENHLLRQIKKEAITLFSKKSFETFCPQIFFCFHLNGMIDVLPYNRKSISPLEFAVE